MGKSGNNSTCNPGGDINNSSIRDSEGSIKQSVILMTVLRRQIKSGAYDSLEKVTGHQDDKPSTAETSTRKHPCWGNCCWRKRSLQQHSACDYTGEQSQQPTLFEEQPQQRSEERRYNQTRNMNKCLTCWRSCHPRESTEIFLSILSTL